MKGFLKKPSINTNMKSTIINIFGVFFLNKIGFDLPLQFAAATRRTPPRRRAVLLVLAAPSDEKAVES